MNALMAQSLRYLIVFNLCCKMALAQSWQKQIGLNLATLPGKSLEIASAWSPDLTKWALTLNVGYTYQNPFALSPNGYACDCGLESIKTSGAFVKAGVRKDVVRSTKPLAKVGLPIGLMLIGSQYRQEGTIHSFSDGTSRYSTQSAEGFVSGVGVSAAMNIRFSSRWNMDMGLQKFIGFQKRTDYLLFNYYMTHQPGVGLTNWKNFWPGMQAIATLNYRLN